MVRRLAFRVMTVTMATVVILTFLEMAVRALLPGTSYGYPRSMYITDAGCEYRLAPSFSRVVSSRQEFSTAIYTNSDGFRDRERGRKEPNAVRILSIGDSFTWGGYGVEVNDTFSAVLEQQLNQSSTRRHEVLNMGVPGWGTDNELTFFQTYGAKYQADVVMLAFCIANDFLDNLETNERTVVNGDLVRTKSVGVRVSALKTLHGFLMSHSMLARWVEQRASNVALLQSLLRTTAMRKGELLVSEASSMKALFGESSDENHGAPLQTRTEQLLVEFKQACDRHGVQFCILAIPATFQVDQEIIDHVVDEYGIDPSRLDQPQRFLSRICEENAITLIDPLEEFRLAHRHTPLYWRLNPHFNRAGNQLAAESAYRGMVASQFLDLTRE